VGAVAYFVCLVLIPKNPEHANLPISEQKKAENSGLYIGVALIVLGVAFAFHKWFDFFLWDFERFFFNFHWKIVWPILLILFGVWYIYKSSQKDEKTKETTKREFFRSPEQKMVGGVCGGLAEYWNVDVTLIRIGYVMATLFTAMWLGVIGYVVMLIVVKERNIEKAHVVETEVKQKPPRRSRTAGQTKRENNEETKQKEGGSDEKE
jgi:phage shock protein PspC (stress-responsive transcriptional regulator)